VAVKQLRVSVGLAELRDDLARESEALDQNRHANVIELIGCCLETLEIVTELVQGSNLSDFLRADQTCLLQPLPLPCLAHIAQAVASALTHMAEMGWVHKDIKSPNILISSCWQVKLCDFGLALQLSARKSSRVAGSPAWMAPEVLLGEECNDKADVYSLGVVMWEMMTGGEIPWADKSNQQILEMVAHLKMKLFLRPSLREHFPEDLLLLVLRCWDHSADQRPSSLVLSQRLQQYVLQLNADQLDSMVSPRHLLCVTGGEQDLIGLM